MARVGRTNDSISIRAAEIELAFSREDGGLRALQRAGGPGVLGHGDGRPSIDVRLDDAPWLAGRSFVRYLGHTIAEHDGATELEVAVGIGPLIVHDCFRITGTLITRSLRVQNVGEDPVRLRGVRLLLPWARIGTLEGCRFEAPGASVRPRVALSVAAEQRLGVLPRRFFAPGLRDGRAIETAPLFTPGLLALHNPELDESLLCWYLGGGAVAFPQVEGNDAAATLQHEVAAAGWLASGGELAVGSQYILVMREPWAGALAAFRRTWPLGWTRPPLDSPGWLASAAIYETHASRFGGLAGLAGALPTIGALGIDTIALMPVWPYGVGPQRLWDGNWQATGDLYAVRDLEALDPTLGQPGALRALVDAAHADGMRVLLDLPMLGCSPESRYLYEHPDWFCHDEQGRLRHVPGRAGVVAFDWASPTLREFFAARFAALVAELGLDGLRAITPRAPLAAWGPDRSGDASAGQLGQLAALDEIRRRITPFGAALVGDLAGPVGDTLQDAAIDELAHHMFVHAALGRMTPAELGDWLDDHRATMPGAGPRVCFTESHRTRLINPLADGMRGSRISRLVLAGLVFCGYTPSIWAGQEDAEAAAIAQLLAVRRERPVLRSGDLRFGAVPCNSPQVFTILRCERAGAADGEHAIGLLNISPHRQTVTLSLPVDTLGLPEGDYALNELVARRLWEEDGRSTWRRDELLAVSLTLEPFAAYCLVAEPAPAAQPAPSDALDQPEDSLSTA